MQEKECANCRCKFISPHKNNKFCNTECASIYKIQQANKRWASLKTPDRKVQAHQRLGHPWSGAPISDYPKRDF